MFNKKAKASISSIHPKANKSIALLGEAHIVADMPRICLFNFPENVLHTLTKEGLNCTGASLGKIVDVPNKNPRDEHFLRLNSSFPENLHEYHIIVLEMDNQEHIPYDPSLMDRTNVRGDRLFALLSNYPETIFDPKPLSANLISQQIDDLLKKESILIVFADENVSVEYKFVEIEASQARITNRQKYSNYSFYSNCPQVRDKSGEVISVAEKAGRLTDFLSRHIEKSKYRAIFIHPTHWDGSKGIKDNNFFPLLTNGDDEIVGYAHFMSTSAVFMFPQVADKAGFLKELLTSELPEIFPSIFPDSKHFAWIEEPAYNLPNHLSLLKQKEKMKTEYDAKLLIIDALIEENNKKYVFLHDLLTQTDASLVNSVEKFLNYLGFPEVVNVDKTQPELREEDLRATVPDGLLVMEVKGIGGTSTDSECSQISKIRFRRSEERKKFDVYGLYIVNHQRHKPPENRRNPPFTEQQIRDAVNDKRGLLTTFQLFRLYEMIEAGIICKEDARKAMLTHGLVEFVPARTRSLGIPKEILKENFVAILTISGQKVSKGDTILVLKDGYYRKGSILSLMDNDVEIPFVENGEIGIKFNIQIPKNAEILICLQDTAKR